MKDLSLVFKALSNEKRLAIFELIRQDEIKCQEQCCDISEGGSCVCDLAKKFSLSQSTVSHHLKELRNADLIEVEKSGLWVYCRVNHNKLKELEEFLSGKK
jgi:ArsR family transcriptional regulator, arsenate/arsenite/antimonite-responsive transcriptional repressor